MTADSDKADAKASILSQVIDKLPAYLTLLTVVIGASQYFEQQRKELLQREAEYNAMRYKETQPLYKEICTLAAQISLAKDENTAQPLMEKFHVLYFGQMPMVQDNGVREAEEQFMTKVEASKASGLFPDPDIPTYVNMLVDACKTSLKKTIEQEPRPSSFGTYWVITVFTVQTLIILCLLLFINRIYQDRKSSAPPADPVIDHNSTETQLPNKP
jgi:hypothetical protein